MFIKVERRNKRMVLVLVIQLEYTYVRNLNLSDSIRN